MAAPAQLVKEIQIVQADKLELHPRNPREGDVGAIVTSIEQNGFFAPLLVQKSTNHIVVGNHRYRAAVQLGMKKLPVVFLDITDDEALRIMLADNRTSDIATNNEAELAELLKELIDSPSSLLGTGFDADDLDSLLEPSEQDWKAAFEVKDGGDNEENIQMTFSIPREQADSVKEILKKFSNNKNEAFLALVQQAQ